MAVVSVEELWPGRDGEDNVNRKRTYTRTFLAITDNVADDATVVGADHRIPRLGAFHPNDPFSWVVKNQPRQSDDSPTLWTVTISYGTDLPEVMARESQQVDENGESQAGDVAKDPSSRAENPLDRQPSWRVDYEQATEVCEEDWQGFPILNSAGDPFDPPLEKEVSYRVVSVSFNVAGINFDLLDQFDDAINNAPWKGRPAYTWRITGLNYESAMENGISFWKVSMRFKYKAKGWLRRVIDRGFREIQTTGSAGAGTLATKLVRIMDKTTGGYPTEPQLLNGSGVRLPDTDADGKRTPPVFLTFHTFAEKNFNALGI